MSIVKCIKVHKNLYKLTCLEWGTYTKPFVKFCKYRDLTAYVWYLLYLLYYVDYFIR